MRCRLPGSLFLLGGPDHGIDADKAQAAAATIAEKLPFLSPEEDEALLREAGFTGVALFYAAFTFRGWVARA